MITEKVLAPDSNEYYRLEMFCKMLNRDSPNKHSYVIRDIYLDVGLDWKWTTIVDVTAGCQVLNPAEWKEIINDIRDLSEIENDFFDNKFCQDKTK